VNTKELIVGELESTSEELLSEVLQFVKSIKRQQPISISTKVLIDIIRSRSRSIKVKSMKISLS
jgi:hypothetical protein